MAETDREVVDVITTKGCMRLFATGSRPSFRRPTSEGAMALSPNNASLPTIVSEISPGCSGMPFSGLVICVTGLSKEARNQVMAATEKLGGQYSASLHPKCTHLVVQNFGGPKYEHALKFGPKTGLFVVTLGWFVDSVRRNVRLNESLYSIKRIDNDDSGNFVCMSSGDVVTCLPIMALEKLNSDTTSHQKQCYARDESSANDNNVFSQSTIYVDLDISPELRKKVADSASRGGAKLLDHWYAGCDASYVVCEGPSIQRYIGHSNNIVTPIWFLKTVKENSLQRLVHLSADIARQVSVSLQNYAISKEDSRSQSIGSVASSMTSNGQGNMIEGSITDGVEERRKIADTAKQSIRERRSRRLHTCDVPIHPLTPTSMLDSICWSVSEPASTACIFTDASLSQDATEQSSPALRTIEGEPRCSQASNENISRPLRDSEKLEVVFKNHFLTILFPIDRFGELGPSSRTFFSHGGFTCIQVLELIFNFYQENLSHDELEVAIHTDSRHADRLRSLYCTEESIRQGIVPFKRLELLGSRRSFEALKRLNGTNNNNNTYELLIRA